MKSLFLSEKKYFTMLYFATLTGTLYFALHLQSTPLTVLCAILQLIATLSFLISHIPGGTTGLMFFTRMFRSSVKSSLPVWKIRLLFLGYISIMFYNKILFPAKFLKYHMRFILREIWILNNMNIMELSFI